MKIKIAFICIGNSCRSQIAEGFAKHMAEDLRNKKIEIYSAGTHPANAVNPAAIDIMKEKGIDISTQHPKSIEEIPSNPDIVITMGCGVECPYFPSLYREDWGIEDPIGMPPEFFKKVRDLIESRVSFLTGIIKSSGSVDEVIKKLKSKKSKK